MKNSPHIVLGILLQQDAWKQRFYMKTISALLGHTQLQLTTDLYMHVTKESLFEGVEQYEKRIQVG